MRLLIYTMYYRAPDDENFHSNKEEKLGSSLEDRKQMFIPQNIENNNEYLEDPKYLKSQSFFNLSYKLLEKQLLNKNIIVVVIFSFGCGFYTSLTRSDLC